MAAVKRGVSPEILIRGAKTYAATVETEQIQPKFRTQAQTWLNQERWDEAQTATPAEKVWTEAELMC